MRSKPTYPKYLSSSIKDLLEGILVADPNDRMTITGIQEHRWYPATKINRPRPLKKVSSSGALTYLHSSVRDSTRAPTSPNLKSKLQSVKEIRKKKSQNISPPLANAFELIGWSGVFDISNILLQAMGPTSIKEKVKTEFVTEEKDLEVFILSIVTAFKNLHFENNTFNLEFDMEKCRGKIVDEEGISGHIQLYTVAPQLYLVNFVQEEGSPEEWYKMYRAVYKLAKNNET